MKTALITGITGQDGSYLAKYLLDLGFKVYGTSRDDFTADLSRLKLLGISEDIELLSNIGHDFRSCLITLKKSNPDFVFHMAGQSSVSFSFKFPFEANESIAISTLTILEAVRFFNKNIRIFIPCSSECFGSLEENAPANEQNKLNPLSPYAVAKSTAYWISKSYRESYELFVCIGFLSNHESPLRGKQFVTSKLFNSIRMILDKKIKKVSFGDLSIIRDWGWTPSYVEAIFKIISSNKPDDYIIATGKSYSLENILDKSFEIAGLENYKNYIITEKKIQRPNELKASYLDPSKIKNNLNWENKLTIDEMIYKLIKNEFY